MMKIIWLHGMECTGCSESLLATLNPSVAEVVLDTPSIRYYETIMAASDHVAEEAYQETLTESFVLAAEGSIPSKEDRYCPLYNKQTVLERLVKAGDTAPFTPRYKPDEFCVSDLDLVITAVAHYLKALEMQAKAKKMSAIFAGKQPHQSSIVVGGVTMYPNIEAVEQFRSMLLKQIDFIENVYLQDVLSLGLEQEPRAMRANRWRSAP